MTPGQRDSYHVDRTGWAPGPWDGEPDRVDWEHAGLPVFALRHIEFGNWAAYVGVPPGHPRYGTGPVGLPLVCYAAACSPPICHVPKPGEPDEIWWFGFDCAHAWDICPGMEAYCGELLDHLMPLTRDTMRTYKELGYVQKCANALADVLAQGECVCRTASCGHVASLHPYDGKCAICEKECWR